ncbi:hypothetical protein CYFUS_008178 [Cystobacter fuscus]|uniref:Uncharacterized protein n=1 Tax=Cystobacter fuscus TaxID=43 RepID=A0A250JFM3_9BACT|nr:hypothetical protein [Cystobacter fuscus]ATB42699.1 hypothetical protein CYFUS_008178 [Cystobacter fuscus]
MNRLDRRPFAPDACGELRLIYRLRYERSRLPFAVNAIYWMKDRRAGNDCAEIARRWDAAGRLGGKALAEYLVSSEGPLAPIDLEPARLKSIEVNLQSVRWPSGVRPDRGGASRHARTTSLRTSSPSSTSGGFISNRQMSGQRLSHHPSMPSWVLVARGPAPGTVLGRATGATSSA